MSTSNGKAPAVNTPRTGVIKVTKAEWSRLGGLRNPRCFRRQRPDGRWLYYYRQD